jgi:hypothetical protein
MGWLRRLQGGLEFVDRHTTIDSPYAEGPGGILISTIDILPSELRTCRLDVPLPLPRKSERGWSHVDSA